MRNNTCASRKYKRIDRCCVHAAAHGKRQAGNAVKEIPKRRMPVAERLERQAESRREEGRNEGKGKDKGRAAVNKKKQWKQRERRTAAATQSNEMRGVAILLCAAVSLSNEASGASQASGANAEAVRGAQGSQHPATARREVDPSDARRDRRRPPGNREEHDDDADEAKDDLSLGTAPACHDATSTNIPEGLEGMDVSGVQAHEEDVLSRHDGGVKREKKGDPSRSRS